LQRLTDKIKAYIKSNKKELMKQKSMDEKKIHEIKIANNPKIRELILSKSQSKSSMYSQPSAAYITDSEDEDFSVPEERDWRKDIQQLKKRTGDFNINNYFFICSEEEKNTYHKIIAKIPSDNRVYIQ